MQLLRVMVVCCSTVFLANLALSQEKSVNPGINDAFRDPDVEKFKSRFEVESREVYTRRNEILAACQIESGQTVADIGAGTGLFTRLFSEAVGEQGRVIAVDISKKFLDHVLQTSRKAGQQNVDTVLAKADSIELPPESVDVAFICDTYHHFEFPQKTMASVFQAMKPGGRVILIDFRRIEGESSDWVLSHVRAGQDVFEREIVRSGFSKVREVDNLLDENYFVVFEKPALVFPIIDGYGGVWPRTHTVEKPRAGGKVVFDITVDAKPGDVNKGLERAARLLNLYGASGLAANDVTIAIVLHGEATKSALNDDAFKERFGIAQNRDLPLIRKLQRNGVDVFVCGQALNNNGYADSQVSDDIPIATAALTVLANKQADGYAYIPVP